jgi:cyclophilin family peptidyl-prolyl cis-trans isomerase
MASVLKACAAVSPVGSVPFLREVAHSAGSPTLANQAIELLSRAGIEVAKRTDREKLYVAPDSILGDKILQLVIHTVKGDIEIELLPEVAPATVSNFITLVRKAFYNQLTFHRVVSDFVIQGGDPRGDGWGGPGYCIPCEYNETEFRRGTIGMATSGKDTGGSQFFICHSDQPHLNGKYTAFGTVRQGMDVVDQIEIDDKIEEITIKP